MKAFEEQVHVMLPCCNAFFWIGRRWWDWLIMAADWYFHEWFDRELIKIQHPNYISELFNLGLISSLSVMQSNLGVTPRILGFLLFFFSVFFNFIHYPKPIFLCRQKLERIQPIKTLTKPFLIFITHQTQVLFKYLGTNLTV